MDAIISKLNNRYLVAIVVGLFLLSVVRRFAGR
jgi:hypothetical protein